MTIGNSLTSSAIKARPIAMRELLWPLVPNFRCSAATFDIRARLSTFVRDLPPFVRDLSPFVRDLPPFVRDFRRSRASFSFRARLSPLLRELSPFLPALSPLLRASRHSSLHSRYTSLIH